MSDRARRLRSLGNAVVPQVAYHLGLALRLLDLCPSEAGDAAGARQ